MLFGCFQRYGEFLNWGSSWTAQSCTWKDDCWEQDLSGSMWIPLLMWKEAVLNWLSCSSDQNWPARTTTECPTGKKTQQRPQLQVADRQSCFSNIWATLTLTEFSSKFFSRFSVSKQVIDPLQGYAFLFQYPNSRALFLFIFISWRTQSAALSSVSSGLDLSPAITRKVAALLH